MQITNWNDLRYLLAVERGRSISKAARLMGVDSTTVSRRLAVLQSTAGVQLYLRGPDGRLKLTAKAAELVRCIEVMEREVDLVDDMLGPVIDGCSGTVRLTSVPIVINRILAPQIGELLRRHPFLNVEMVPESRNVSLTRREADLALRLARPIQGGGQVKTRRVGTLSYSVYGSSRLPETEATRLPWITYEDEMAHIPQARWLTRIGKREGDRCSGLKVHDGETALEAVAAGVGRSLLADVVAEGRDDLVKLVDDNSSPPPSREVWLLAHSDQLLYRRIKVVIEWLERAIKLHKVER